MQNTQNDVFRGDRLHNYEMDSPPSTPDSMEGKIDKDEVRGMSDSESCPSDIVQGNGSDTEPDAVHSDLEDSLDENALPQNQHGLLSL